MVTMKSSNRKLNTVVILTLVYLESNQCATVDVNNLNKLWSLSSVNHGSRTSITNSDRGSAQGLAVVPNQVRYVNLINSSSDSSNGVRPSTNTATKQELPENRDTTRHRNYRRNRLLSSDNWTPRLYPTIPLSYNQEFQPQIENSLKVFDNEIDKSKRDIVSNDDTESIKNVYIDKEPELANTAVPIIINSDSYIPKPIPLFINQDGLNINGDIEESSREKIGNVIAVKRADPSLPMRRSFLDFEDESDYDDEPEYSKVKRKHTEGEEEVEEEDPDADDYETEGLEKKGRPKLKKKYIKYMLPLLLAYKLKFFTLVPLLMGGLVLLTGATGMAGFFFALFAAVMGLKGGH